MVHSPWARPKGPEEAAHKYCNEQITRLRQESETHKQLAEGALDAQEASDLESFRLRARIVTLTATAERQYTIAVGFRDERNKLREEQDQLRSEIHNLLLLVNHNHDCEKRALANLADAVEATKVARNARNKAYASEKVIQQERDDARTEIERLEAEIKSLADVTGG